MTAGLPKSDLLSSIQFKYSDFRCGDGSYFVGKERGFLGEIWALTRKRPGGDWVSVRL